MIVYFKSLSDALFFSFQQYLCQVVTTNAVVWLIPSDRVTELTQFKNQYEMMYGFITNKLTRTPIQVQAYRTVRDEYEQFIEGLANAYIIFNPLINKEQINAMGFNVRNSGHSPRPQITSVVFGGLDALPGSQVQFTCRTATETKRASILDTADCVEVRYAIGTQPATVDNCPLVAMSTKAKFTLDISPVDAGKRIYAYLRWRNNSDVEKSGPWSDSLNTVVRS
ncbi:MAG: hypothetical protein SH857_07305 [Chitinophagales bacterium]|nr:hypothetical protein [Chitinophagales bacterium]